MRPTGSTLKVLGIETSCDETAAAVVTGERAILSSVVLSQLEDHRQYGGVVPEVAARAHIEHRHAAFNPGERQQLHRIAALVDLPVGIGAIGRGDDRRIILGLRCDGSRQQPRQRQTNSRQQRYPMRARHMRSLP